MRSQGCKALVAWKMRGGRGGRMCGGCGRDWGRRGRILGLCGGRRGPVEVGKGACLSSIMDKYYYP